MGICTLKFKTAKLAKNYVRLCYLTKFYHYSAVTAQL